MSGATMRRVRRVRPRLRDASPFTKVAQVIAWIVAAVIAVPLLVVIVELVIDQPSTGSVAATFALPGIAQTLLNTAIVILSSTVIATVIACVLAWLNERTNARMGFITDVLPIMPLLVPSIAGAVGWMLLASPTAGFLNVGLRGFGEAIGVDIPPLNIFSWPGLIFVYSIYMVPQIYLTLVSALRNIDPALEEAARVNGAGVVRVLTTVTLPAVRPAIISGALLGLVYGIAMFSVPLIIGTQAHIDILTVQVVRLLAFTFPPEVGQALTLSLIVAAVLGLLWWLNSRLMRKGNFATVGGKGGTGRLTRLGPVGRTLCRAFMIIYILVVSIIPLAALVLVSFQGYWSGKIFTPLSLANYQDIFKPGSTTLQGLANSVGLGILSATIAVALAVLIWSWMSRDRSGWQGSLIDGVTKLPATISHIVIAVALLAMFSAPPFSLSGTLALLVLAYVVLYIPQASLSTQSATQMVGRELSEASWVSGAGPGRTVGRIVLPLARGGLISGWVFVFILVAGDITASALLASPSSPVVGFLITSLFQNGSYPVLAALATIISLVSTVVVLSVLAVAARRRAFEKGNR